MSKYDQYCCIKLLSAIEDNFVCEVVSGFYLPNKDKNEPCLDGNPHLNHCPFCGAKITTVKTDTGWDWTIQKSS